jgi:Ssp1 endopeptidase immunity protein Rap1a
MRVAWLVAASLLLAFGSGQAQAMSGRDLLNSCDAAMRTLKGSGADVSIAPAGQRCWNYMEAVQDMLALADESGRRLFGVCVPEDGRTEGLVRTFTKYAHAHADELNSRASVVVLYSLQTEFPCR